MTFGGRVRRRLGQVALYRAVADARLRRRSPEAIFRDIVARNKWRGSESASGPGSSLDAVATVIEALPVLLRELGVRSMLDVPCGDFNWMQRVDLSGIDYHGADLLTEVVEQDVAAHARPGVRFSRLDLLTDEMPRVDLILCRDCLVHFSNADALSALRRLCASGATFLLTTTFTARATNSDIVTGRWRPLDLEAAPFGLPPPVHLIVEGATADAGEYPDKSLALWRIDTIRDVIERASRDR